MGPAFAGCGEFRDPEVTLTLQAKRPIPREVIEVQILKYSFFCFLPLFVPVHDDL